MTGPKDDKGSRRHMLDLVASPKFTAIINRLLEGTGACLAEPDCRHPKGRCNEEDWTEEEIEDYLVTYPHLSGVTIAADWWFPYKTNRNRRPTWDLISHITVEGKPGVLLVEAKAHVGELKEQDSKECPAKDKPRRMANDYSIRLRLCEASLGLTSLGIGAFQLSADSHYQLSNRLAYLHKLASSGVPTVLMYLGWLESPDWPTDPLRNAQQWKDLVQGHVEGIAPLKFVESAHEVENKVGIQMIVRSEFVKTLGE